MFFISATLLRRYSLTVSTDSLMVLPAQDRSAVASVSSKACSSFRSGSPSISMMRPEKMFFLPAFSTVSRPCWIAT